MALRKIHIVGAGLAGSEAAWFLARHAETADLEIHLHEMRPKKMTEAHHTDRCAELVCSNSFKTTNPLSAPGMMKAEMKAMGSLALEGSEVAKVPAGEALAVDRDVFAKYVTEKLASHPRIFRHSEEVTEPFADGITLFATGPLTSEPLTQWLIKATAASAPEGQEGKDLYFYDAIAPIVDASSLDHESIFLANRYDKGGEEAYLNCPLTEEEYEAFLNALIAGEKVPPKNFEKEILFQGCQPIESIAATGRETLRFGPMKPVGLTDPRTGRRPYACVQLRAENASKTAYNLVGFQTKLKYGEQAKIFRMIPALKNAEFLRLGSIHRNTYVCGPRVLRADLSLRGHPKVYLAGQITGVEGYLESAACGLMAANFIYERLLGRPLDVPPPNTAMGALLRYITGSDPATYQPINACFAIYDPAVFEGAAGLRKDDLRKLMAEQSIENFGKWWEPRPAAVESSNANPS
ncbi:MAG: methylenetetrahydrofolate--tRNA-(uracil(54)-C(5))-methyltransferase (FADH(2)-oxidizing) TrmFO [Cryobacterium sp.]|nr:methylenetetrahydrofolate--tRNA-(uracil(54)-C(5))-methyltransferase (FADH(2)-oxidizing) TrmFO [Oligoflexia bacterium]